MASERWVQPPLDGMPALPEEPAAPPQPRWYQPPLFEIEDLPRSSQDTDILGRHLLSLFPEARRVRDVLGGRRYALAFAESCTGGLAAAVCTAVAGSGYVRGGAVVYSTEAKIALGVRPETLARFHAVSPEVAAELAVCTMLKPGHDTNIGIGITGLAGPGGDGSPRAVGEVYVAIAFREDRARPEHDLKVVQLARTEGLDREAIRARAVRMALMLIEEVAEPRFGWPALVTIERRAVPHTVIQSNVRPESTAIFRRQEVGEIRPSAPYATGLGE